MRAPFSGALGARPQEEEGKYPFPRYETVKVMGVAIDAQFSLGEPSENLIT